MVEISVSEIDHVVITLPVAELSYGISGMKSRQSLASYGQGMLEMFDMYIISAYTSLR